MSFNLVFPSIKLARKTFRITILVQGYPNNYYPHLINFGELTVGNDDHEDEMILMPGSFKMKFHIERDKFEEVFAWLHSKDTWGNNARIFLDEITGTPVTIFRGGLILSTIAADIKDSTFTVTFMDGYQMLKKPAVWFDNPEFTKVNTFITGVLLGGDISGVVLKTDIKYRYYLNNNVPPTIADGDLSNLAIRSSVLTDTAKYKTNGDILKALLNNFGSRSVISNDRIIIAP
ncbi:MAG: hypothetical protein U1C59_03215, partial [Methylotenera sp.]|nr:hypothetical protein [Methylotenera sp.]